MFLSCDSMREREAIKTMPHLIWTYVGELSGNATGALIINIKKSGSVEVTKTFQGTVKLFYRELYLKEVL